MKTVLVTGAEGFVGSHLIKELKDTLNKIVPTCYPLLRPKWGRHVPLDILNLDMTREVVKTYQPDLIVHLAAVSSVGRSFRDRPNTYQTNIMGTTHLLEAATALGKQVRFLYVSSCEVYGGGENLTEDAPINLKSPYAISKYAAELICRDYGGPQLEWLILRPFNHSGPEQSEDFVLPTIARQVAEIEQHRRPPVIDVGNLNVKREFMNVRDVIRAYHAAIDKCSPGLVLNISSGRGYTLQQAIDILRGLARVQFETRVDPGRIRASDVPVLIGNGDRFRSLTGWNVRIGLEKTLEELLNYWRAKIPAPNLQ